MRGVSEVQQCLGLQDDRGPYIVPVVPCSACEIARRGWERRAVAGCGVPPVAAVVPVFPAGIHRRDV